MIIMMGGGCGGLGELSKGKEGPTQKDVIFFKGLKLEPLIFLRIIGSLLGFWGWTQKLFNCY